MSFTDLLARWFGSSDARSGAAGAGVRAVASGTEALVALECRYADAIVLGDSVRGGDAGGWLRQRARGAGITNFDGRGLTVRDAERPRDAVATAVGLSLTGLRSAVFLTGPELAEAEDQLARAASHHVPLVVHVACESEGGTSEALGGGHGVLRRVPAVVLFAADGQRAVDLALVARALAEQALVPVVVAHDGVETASSLQDVVMPEDTVVVDLIGRSDDDIPPGTDSQRIMFGERRRRVPRWYDLDDPLLFGPLHDADSWGARLASQAPYFDQHVPALLERQLQRASEALGRALRAVEWRGPKAADVCVVAQGAAAIQAAAVARQLRASGTSVGVLELCALRPPPVAAIEERLSSCSHVVVLERAPASLDDPLSTSIAALLFRRGASGARRPRDSVAPELTTLRHGLGSGPLEAGDLQAALLDLPALAGRSVELGYDFAPGVSDFPKRQILWDRLARERPELRDVGFRAPDERRTPAPDARGLGVRFHELSSATPGAGRANVSVFARVLGAALGGAVRSRVARTWEVYDAAVTDELRVGDGSEEFIGWADVDLAVVAMPATHHDADPGHRLRLGGHVLLEGPSDGSVTASARVLEDLRTRQAAVHLLPSPGESDDAAGDAVLQALRRLGAAVAVLSAAGRLEVSERRVRAGVDALAEGLGRAPDALLEAMASGGRLVRAIDLDALASGRGLAEGADVPAALRRLSFEESGSGLGSLPRFFGQVGVLYRSSTKEALHPDPFLAAGAVPPLSSAFRSTADARLTLPELDAGQCTGCGACWTMCPDGAIGPLALEPRALIEAGIALAERRGASVQSLRPALGKLAKRATKRLGESEPPRDVSTWIREAASGSSSTGSDELGAAVDAVASALDGLPLVASERLARAAETPAVLTLAIDPDACKGCAGCVAACPEGALVARPQTAPRIERARTTWRLWEELPDTPGAMVEALRQQPDYDELPAVLLSRACRVSLGGGDGVEPGSGAKIAIRQALASAEFHGQRALAAHLAEVDARRSAVRRRIEQLMEDALREADLERLGEAVEHLSSGRAPLSELTGALERAGSEHRVDAVALQRLIRVARDLDALHDRLRTGAHGLGRARTGVVFAPDARSRGLGVFPFNPFQAPVVVESGGEAAAVAAGLLEGQVREVLSGIRALRRARLELDNPKRADLQAADLEKLGWDDLTDAERRLCPPLLVIGSESTLGDHGLARLLDSNLPLKVLLLVDVGRDLARTSPGQPAPGSTSAVALAIRHAGAFVAQSSVAATSHVSAAWAQAWQGSGPAVVAVHAPSPGLHGYPAAQTLARAQRALDARVFPLFVHDPRVTDGPLLDLRGNPEPEAEWARGGAFRPADWLQEERRFAAHFDGEAREPSVAARDFEARRAREWAVLRELAGVASPLAARVAQKTRAEMEAQLDAALAQRDQAHAAHVAQLEAELTGRIARRVREGLMELAGYRASTPAEGEAGGDT